MTKRAAAKQVGTQPASPPGVDGTPKGGTKEHDARSAQLPTELPSINPTVRPMVPAPTTTVTQPTLPDEDYHIDNELRGPYIAQGLKLTPRHLDGPQIKELTCDAYRYLCACRHNATLEE
jgi:hypothetical protein